MTPTSPSHPDSQASGAISTPSRRSTLGEILVRCGILSEAQLEKGLREQKSSGKRLGETLIDLGMVRRDDIEWALSSQFQIPMVRIRDLRVERSCASLIPEGLARQYRLAPLFVAGNELSVVVDDPVKIDAIEDIEQISGHKVNVSLTSPEEVTALLEDLYGSKAETRAESGPRQEAKSPDYSEEQLQPLFKDITGKALLRFILESARREEATAVILQAREGNRFVQFRVGGLLRERITLRDDWYRILLTRLSILAGHEQKLPDGELEAAFTCEVGGESVAFTLSVFDGPEGPTAVVHATAWEPPIPSLMEMELPPEKKVLLPFFLRRRGGLWIATGSGADRGVVLHALHRAFQFKDAKTVSFRRDSRELNLGDGATARMQCMKSQGLERDIPFCLRNAYDVTLLDWAYEPDELVRLFHAALTGTTILTSCTMPNAESLLRYLLAEGISAPLLTSAINGIIRYGVVRLLCPHCRQVDRSAEPSDIQALDLPLGGGPFFRPEGCDRCGRSGYERSQILLDFVPMAGPVKRALQRSGSSPDVGHINGDLASRACDLVRAGRISIDDVFPFLEI